MTTVLSASVDVSLCFCFGCVEAGALKNNVYTEFSPRAALSASANRVDLDLFAINSDRILTVGLYCLR